MNSAKLAVSLGAVTLALSGLTASAATNVVSDPVGFYKIAINPGANPISAPLQQISVFKGTVASVSGDNINFTGMPGFTPSAFVPTTVNASLRAQYFAIVCKDSDKANGAPDNVTGDWWTISMNSTTNITVVNGGDVISSLVSPGDQVEIRKLSTIADLFGAGAASILAQNPDPLGEANPSQCDMVGFWNGLSIGDRFSYINETVAGPGAAGYYINGDGPYDGTQLSILPTEPLVFFRLAGATNICVLGGVQTKPITHYFVAGANTLGAVFPASAPWGTSGLENVAGWVDDPTGEADPNLSDIVGLMDSTLSISQRYSYIDQGPGTQGWFDGNVFPTPTGIDPTKNYFVIVSGNRKWRQPVPFNP